MNDASSAYAEILARLDRPPVLVDVGASGDPPAIWSGIASASVFVGFDPDLREMRDHSDSGYRRSVIINEAVTDRPDADQLRFYLTSSPYCSSTLLPDTAALEQYVFSDLFKVEGEVSVRATTLDKVVQRVGVPGIDWLKVDSQGTDLRLFTGMSETLRAGVLAIDVEPGLIDAYLGEDLYVDAHKALTKAGFWLSDLEVKGAVRVKRSTRDALRRHRPELDDEALQRAVRTTPGWCEARYLRTIESLAARGASERDHALLWIFAMADAQLGFALDVAYDFKQRFPESPIGALLLDGSTARLERALQPPGPAPEPVEPPPAAELASPLEHPSPPEPARFEEPSIWRRLQRWTTGR